MTKAQQDIDLGDHDLADNVLVDFCCMDTLEFTLQEAANYHDIPVTWYNLDHVLELSNKGYFTVEVV